MTDEFKLPELPPYLYFVTGHGFFNSDQMRAYALAAVEAYRKEILTPIPECNIQYPEND